MALWFPIMVNNFEVGRVELVRIDPVDRAPVQNEICTYNLWYFSSPRPAPHSLKTTIEFPYLEKNPVPLLSAALQLIDAIERSPKA